CQAFVVHWAGRFRSIAGGKEPGGVASGTNRRRAGGGRSGKLVAIGRLRRYNLSLQNRSRGPRGRLSGKDRLAALVADCFRRRNTTMGLAALLHRLPYGARLARARRSKPLGYPRRRPRLEALEDRDLPSRITVVNNLDSGPGSLRAAVADAK